MTKDKMLFIMPYMEAKGAEKANNLPIITQIVQKQPNYC